MPHISSSDQFAPRPASPIPVKQVIVARRDLKIRKGKGMSQAAHGPLITFFNAGVFDGDDENGGSVTVKLSRAEWLWARYNFKKVVLGCPDEATLMAIHEAALAAGLKSTVVEDSGLTEFHGVTTRTVLTIGPDFDDRIDAITGKEGLFKDLLVLL